jgi:dTDP-glucose 4,6-dehydratase
MQKILITGSCGMIGSSLIRKIIYEKLPYKVSSIDRVNYNNINAVYWNKQHSFNISDLTDQHIVNTIFQYETPEIVIHTAATDKTDIFNDTSNQFIKDNVLATQVVINASLKYGVSKFIYLSDEQVYGAFDSYAEENSKEEDEQYGHPLFPSNPYAASKLAAEELVKSNLDQSHNRNISYNIIRSSNTYGPYQRVDKLIPKTIKCIINKEKIPIYNKGEQLRDWMHVFDHCSGIMSILDKGRKNNIYNLSAGQEFSTLEVVQQICNIMGGHSLIEFVENNQKKEFRHCVDNALIKKLGWQPNYKFKEAISSVCDWYQTNKWALK